MTDVEITEQAKAVAGAVISQASLVDARFQEVTRDLVLFWALSLQEAGVLWPNEALAAVRAHYSKPNPFPLFPGDVIAYCKAQPVHSSPEHARWAFLDACRRGSVEAMAALSCRRPPALSEMNYPADLEPWEFADHEKRVYLEWGRSIVNEVVPEIVGHRRFVREITK